jgi:hypothetical protein
VKEQRSAAEKAIDPALSTFVKASKPLVRFHTLKPQFDIRIFRPAIKCSPSSAMLDRDDCAMLKMSGGRLTTFDFRDLRQSRLQK